MHIFFSAQPHVHMLMLRTVLKQINLGNCDLVKGRVTKACALA